MDSEEVLMRKVVASELVSLDGVVESPEKWHGCSQKFAAGFGKCNRAFG
jgi:hypothetical protein